MKPTSSLVFDIMLVSIVTAFLLPTPALASSNKVTDNTQNQLKIKNNIKIEINQLKIQKNIKIEIYHYYSYYDYNIEFRNAKKYLILDPPTDGIYNNTKSFKDDVYENNNSASYFDTLLLLNYFKVKKFLMYYSDKFYEFISAIDLDYLELKLSNFIEDLERLRPFFQPWGAYINYIINFLKIILGLIKLFKAIIRLFGM